MKTPNTVKDFLAALDRLENDALASRDGYGYSSGDAETIRRVLAENEELRKERDELARAIIKIHEDQEGDYDFLKFISHPQYILAKKVNENGNA